MKKQPNVLRGLASGAVGGLVGAVVMGWFISRPGQNVEEAIDRWADKPVGASPHGDNASKKIADAVTHLVLGKHLTSEAKQKAPIAVHFPFSVITGAVYGALTEIAPQVGEGVGSAFGIALFGVVGFPALVMGQEQQDDDLRPGEVASSLAAHIVYGVVTDLGRRLTRLYW